MATDDYEHEARADMNALATLFQARMLELAAERGGGSPERLAAELRLPARNIARYCAGAHQPRLKEAVLIAERAEVSLDWLVGLTDQRAGRGAPVPAAPPESDTPPRKPRPRRSRGARSDT